MSMGTVGRESTLDDAAYRRLADGLLAHIERTIDRWLQDDVIDIDAQRTGGLLELAFPNGSKLIVNLQPPLHEVWLAAKAGGFHFRWHGSRWVDSRSGTSFEELFSRHASAQAGAALTLSVSNDR